MNIQWSPIDDIIANLEVTYNINSNNYIHKLPLWITQGLANYAVYIPMEAAVVELDIENDDMIYIPIDAKNISAVSYKGVFIPQGKSYRGFTKVPLTSYTSMFSFTGFQVEIVKDEQGNVISTHKTDIDLPIPTSQDYREYRYYVNNSRVITMDLGRGSKTGEKVKLYYVRLPHSHDANTGQYLPMIPDNEIVKQNLTWFVLQNLLYSGYSHPVLNLGAGMPYLNPAKMYTDTLPKARSSFLVSDRADFGKIKNLFTTLLHNYGDASANLQQH